MPGKKEKQPLSVTHPELAREAEGWDPSQITYGSGKKFLWRCNSNHTWEAKINNRTASNSGCPYCSNSKVLIGFNDIQTTHPEIANEADGWDPKSTTFGSGSLRTARDAAEIFRPVMAVPGPINSPTSEGCHRLIIERVAELVSSVSEVMELVKPISIK